MSEHTKNSGRGPILVCLDGSRDSDAAGRLAIKLAKANDVGLVAAHVYDARIHEARFEQMEPGLPEKYQAPDGLEELRSTHTTLMTDGFEALSRGYLIEFVNRAQEAGLRVETVVEEGRNYVQLLDIAGRVKPGLTAFGAAGLGDMGDGILGSTAVRLMRNIGCDLLLARASAPANGPVLVGIDGSDPALNAMAKAENWTRAMDASLHLAAAFDPALHQHVFKAMADTMPPEAQTAVGLDKQQELHESLIDEGLGTLYQAFLDDAAGQASNRGQRPEIHLVPDKAYRALGQTADSIGASIICLGRFGHHREQLSDLGATAETVARLSHTNVFIASSPAAADETREKIQTDLPWDPDALERLKGVPRFARKMARRGIESLARKEGADRVTADHVEQAADRFRRKGSRKD